VVTDTLNRRKDPFIEPITTHRDGGKVPNGRAFALCVLLKLLSQGLAKLPYLIPVRIGG
jgi:hypothetical protein